MHYRKMWKTLILVAFATTFIEGCTYKKKECPDYTVVEQHSDYEIRSYPGLTWASTSQMAKFQRVGQYTTFMRLFRYISGKNDRGQKMEMTAPVRMQKTAYENATLFGMSFVVPSEFADQPPVPNDDEVIVAKEGPTLYAVRSFDGYIWFQSKWTEEAKKLADSVKGDKTVDRTTYFQVGYDAPYDFFHRRNEIWMVKSKEIDNEL